jgi:hypothetical protein
VKRSLTSTEAIYGFVAWLLSRRELISIGNPSNEKRTDDGKIMELMEMFKDANGLPDARKDWNSNLKYPKEREF